MSASAGTRGSEETTIPASLLAMHPDGILLLDAEGAVVGGSDVVAVDPALASAVRAACASGVPARIDVRRADGRIFRAVVQPLREGDAPFAAIATLADITDRVESENRLRRSEALLEDAQSTARMGRWEWDPTQPHAWWSAELYRIYGVTPQTYTPSYEGYLQLVHPDDRQRVIDATNAVFHQHVPYSHDERILRPDGSLRHLHTWAHPVLDAQGKLSRLVGVCQDVTEQKRADAALRSQTMARSLVRRLVLDIVQKARVSEAVLRELGRGLARDQDLGTQPQAYLDAFHEMGLGNLTLIESGATRVRFTGSDLLERTSGASLPTCALALGYLEGALARVHGRIALGTELKCQSTGAQVCEFVIRIS